MYFPSLAWKAQAHLRRSCPVTLGRGLVTAWRTSAALLASRVLAAGVFERAGLPRSAGQGIRSQHKKTGHNACQEAIQL